ncbi:histone-lysine N-methyltransferase SETD1B-like, partial [Diaphorina citri]|uniref:Histone-lysine N-methyltransferase SETD1B-like n=1 Tax=Diaphorina citri TaxID=121845 RepID=A0A1S3DNG8_DIACI
CVNIQYAAFDQSLEFNMTFGENELHSQSVDVDSIEPVCMNLVGDVPIAYICATLSKFKLAGDRMRGCVHLEPSILGETQARYFVGCFGQGNDTRNGTRVTGPGKVSSKVGNKTSSGENASAGSTGSASVETSGEASSSSGEDEDDSDPTDPAAGGYIEQGANILSNLFYYFSPDSPEEEESDASKPEKIVLVSSTEVAGKEDAGASELPPPASSEEYDSTGAGSDDGEEEEDESAGGETSESGPSGPSAPGASDGSASAGR